MALATTMASSGESTSTLPPRDVERGLDLGPAGRVGGEPGHLGLDGVGDGLVPRDQPGQAVGAVLGLHDHVDGGVGVGDTVPSATTTTSDGPAKAEGTPTQALAGHLALGDARRRRCPGPTITSTARDRLGAVGEGGDGLGAADGVHGVGAGDGRGGQHDVGHGAVGPGRHAHRRPRARPATLAGITVISTVDG